MSRVSSLNILPLVLLVVFSPFPVNSQGTHHWLQAPGAGAAPNLRRSWPQRGEARLPDCRPSDQPAEATARSHFEESLVK